MRGVVPEGYRECPSCGLYTPRDICRCGAPLDGNSTHLAGGGMPTGGEKYKAVTEPPSSLKRKGPNKTESLYRDRYLGESARYEALSLRMSNGHRYTPDWVVIRNGRIECHEVKGSYRMHSHQRARLAFDQAAVEFPCFVFVWAEMNKEREWKVEVHNA